MDVRVAEGLLYTREHEWVKIEKNTAFIGITDFAQQSLGDIVFIELPALDKELVSGDVVAVVESVKTASEVYSPVSGRVTEVNSALVDSPELINNDPYGSWMVKVELSGDATETGNLMQPSAYRKLCEEEGA